MALLSRKRPLLLVSECYVSCSALPYQQPLLITTHLRRVPCQVNHFASGRRATAKQGKRSHVTASSSSSSSSSPSSNSPSPSSSSERRKRGAVASRQRFLDALDEASRAKTRASHLWVRFADWFRGRNKEADDTSLLDDGNSARPFDYWILAGQPLRFPTDSSWPPPLPGMVDHFYQIPGSSAPPPSTIETIAGPRTPKEIAALALNVHRFALPPMVELRHDPKSGETKRIWRPNTNSYQLQETEKVWDAERNTRLEFLGDALAGDISKRLVFDALPGASVTTISHAASHLVTNDTFKHLYEASGLMEMRRMLAGSLFQEAIERRIKQAQEAPGQHGISAEGDAVLTVPLSDEEFSKLPDIVKLQMEKSRELPMHSPRADRFEAYLAFVRLAHGADVAHEWFAALVKPWLDRLRGNDLMRTTRSMTSAAIVRRELENRQREAERKALEDATNERFQRFGSLAVTARGLLGRIVGRDAKSAGDSTAGSAQEKAQKDSNHSKAKKGHNGKSR